MAIAGCQSQVKEVSEKPALITFGRGSPDKEAQLGPVRVGWLGAPGLLFQRPRQRKSATPAIRQPLEEGQELTHPH